MHDSDLLGFGEVMGCYAGYRWNQPTGEANYNTSLQQQDLQVCCQMLICDSHAWLCAAVASHCVQLQAQCLLALSCAGHYELSLGLPVHAAIAARLRDDAQGSPDGFSWINLLHDMAS
jgi:hypothetical protein